MFILLYICFMYVLFWKLMTVVKYAIQIKDIIIIN